MRKKLLKQGDLAVVEWIDAVSQDEWEHQDEIEIDPEHVQSVGMVYEHTKDKLTLALNHDPANDCFSCLMCIPTGMIRSIRKLE